MIGLNISLLYILWRKNDFAMSIWLFFNGQSSEALEHLWADRNIIQNSEFWCQNWFAYSCICQTIFQHAVYCQQKKTVSPAWVSWMCVQIRNSQNLMCVIMHWTVNEFHFQWKSSCPSSRCNILISTQFMCDLYFGWLNLCELFRNQV